MASFSVVVVEPWCKGCRSFVVAGEHLPVGPLGGECSVEAFDLAVLPWAVRADELVRDLPLREEFAKSSATPVAPSIVGHLPFDRDAVASEELDRTGKELGCGVGLFVGVDLGERQPAVIVNDGVNVVVADLGLLACR